MFREVILCISSENWNIKELISWNTCALRTVYEELYRQLYVWDSVRIVFLKFFEQTTWSTRTFVIVLPGAFDPSVC